MQKTLNQLKILDSLLISWAGWDYKTYSRKTGYGEGLFDEQGQFTRRKLKILYSRPYARAVAGTLHSMKYDDDLGFFYLNWTIPANTPSHVETEVFLHKAWHYPLGYKVHLEPFGRSHWRSDGNVLFISCQKSTADETYFLKIEPN